MKPAPITPAQPTADPGAAGPSVADFMAGAGAERKASADTVIDEATGERSTPVAAAAVAPEKPPMSEGEALTQAGVLMGMRESVQALGLAYLADGSLDTWQQYKYEPWAMALLKEAWAPIIQGSNFRVNKWLRVLHAEGISTAPLVMMTLKARKYRLELEAMKDTIAGYEVERRAQELAAQQQTARAPFQEAAKPAWDRMSYDSEMKWGIDDNGFFKNGKDGYITEANRREKPVFTDAEVYNRVVKWNGKERVDKIFKL